MTEFTLSCPNMPKLDFTNGLPLANQIAHFYRREILRKKLRAGTRLPTCLAIGRALGLAPRTVNRAFDLLAREGLIHKRRSLGTIVGLPLGSRVLSASTAHHKRTLAPPVSLVVRGPFESAAEHEHNLMFNDYLNGLMDGFDAWKCRFEIARLQPDQPEIDLVRALVETGQTRGFIIFNMPAEIVEYLLPRRVPMVMLDKDLTAKGVSSVMADHITGYTEAWKYVDRLGHRRAAFCGIDRGFDLRLRECIAARELAAAACRLTRPACFAQEADAKMIWRALASQIGMDQKSSARPTVLFTQTDLVATRIIRTVMDHGLRVPQDLSVVGFNDSSLAGHFNPALTTLNRPRYRMALAAAHCLLDILAKRPGSADRLYIFPTRLIQRETCAPPPA